MGEIIGEQLDRENFEESEQERIEIEFSEKEFSKLLSSGKFLEYLRVAGKEEKKSGCETGFNVYFFADGELEFGHIIKGGPEYTNPNITESHSDDGGLKFEYNIVKGGIDLPSKKDFAIIDFHFHPNDGQPLCPSEADLQSLGIIEDSRQVELSGICINQGNDENIDILLIKLKRKIHKIEVKYRAESFTDNLERKYGVNLSGSYSYKRSLETDRDVEDALNENGFENCLISYHYNKKTKKYSLTDESKEKILKFGGLKFKLDKKYE